MECRRTWSNKQPLKGFHQFRPSQSTWEKGATFAWRIQEAVKEVQKLLRNRIILLSDEVVKTRMSCSSLLILSFRREWIATNEERLISRIKWLCWTGTKLLNVTVRHSFRTGHVHNPQTKGNESWSRPGVAVKTTSLFKSLCHHQQTLGMGQSRQIRAKWTNSQVLL